MKRTLRDLLFMGSIEDNAIQHIWRRYACTIKRSLSVLLILFLIIPVKAQTVYLTSSGGFCCDTEKWMSITTGVNGSGTLVWGQGNGTIGNGSGLLSDVAIDLSAYCGQTLYLNAYDQYDDGWENAVYQLEETASGPVIINNGGSSPSDAADTDASGSWDGSAAEIEVSESFTVTCSGPVCQLFSEDFESYSTGNVSDSGPPYPFEDNDNIGGSCVAADGWRIATANASGTSCSGCASERAVIDYGSSSCEQDATLRLGTFTPTGTSVDLSFDYGFDNEDGNEHLYVYLYNTTTTTSSLVLDRTTDCDNCTFSSTETVVSGDTYELWFRYTAFYDWGATVDNILVTETCPTDDQDSRIDASAALTEPASISSIWDTQAEKIDVFDFTLTDLGSGDGLATILDALSLTKGASNDVADWSSVIAGARLDGPDVTGLAGTITANSIDFVGASMISVADNSNETYTLSIWLASTVTDGSILDFRIDDANITTDASGTSFGTYSVESGSEIIEVVGTTFNFVQEPTNTCLGTVMTPAVVVAMTDENGNVDTDFSGGVGIISTAPPGSMTVTSPVFAVNGVTTFNDIVHTTLGTGYTLFVAQDGGGIGPPLPPGLSPEGTSAPFDIDDTADPVITCPLDVTVNTDTGLCTASGVSLGTATATDDCDPSPAISNNAAEPYNLGANTVTWTATDASGKTATCNQNITVSDVELPTITCPVNVTASTDLGLCTATGIVLGSPTGADNCGVPTFTNNASEPYAVGTNTVTWTATDAFGNTANCNQTVTVSDNELPTIMCPSNITVSTCTPPLVVNYTAPIGADNCAGPTTLQTAGLGSGAAYPIGITTETYEVTDGNGNTANCSFTIEVTNSTGPVLTTNPVSAITLTTAVSGGNITDDGGAPVTVRGVVWNTTGNPTLADNSTSDGSGTGAFASNLTGLTPGTTYYVSAYATNACGTTYGNVLVFTTGCVFLQEDFEGETANAIITTTPGGLYQTDASSGCGAPTINNSWWIEDDLSTPLSNECDNCTGQYALVDYASCSQDYTLVLGTFELTATTDVTIVFDYVFDYYFSGVNFLDVFLFDGSTATSLNGFPKNSADAEEDNYTDTQSLPPGTYSLRFRYFGYNDYGAAVDNILVTGTCQVYDPEIIATPLSVSGLDYCVGSGPSAAQTFDVSGADLTDDITLTAPLNFELSTDNISFSNSITLTQSSGEVVNTTIYARLVTGLTAGSYAGDVTASSAGATDVLINLSGAVGNLPVVSVTDAATAITATTATSGGNVSSDGGLSLTAVGVCWNTGGTPTIADNTTNDGNSTGAFTSSLTGLTPGTTYYVRAYATNACGTVYGPEISFTTLLIYCDPNPSSVDNKGITRVQIPVGIDNDTEPVSPEPGNYADYSNLSATVVQGTTVPVDITYETGYTYVTKIWVDWNNDGDFDDVGEEVYSGTSSAATPTTLNASFNVPLTATSGPHRLRIGGTDTGPPTPCYTGTYGSYEDYTINVESPCIDAANPVITCPTDVVVSNDGGECYATGVSLGIATASDDCDPPTPVITNDAPAQFNVGVTVVEWTATDGALNSATCNQNVTVLDTEQPSINCPMDITVGSCGNPTVVNYITPIGTDNCTGSVTIQTEGLPSGGTFPIGPTLNTYEVTDGAGTKASCSFVITVDGTDSEDPVAICQDLTVTLNGADQASIMAYYPDAATDFAADPTSVQNQCAWSYGKYDVAFDASTFVLLPNKNGNAWLDNEPFGTPFVDATGGHPGFTSLDWVVRRWTSSYTGNVDISGVFFDRDTGCGDGAHVRVFLNGVEIYQYLNIPGSSTPYSILNLAVSSGDVIDFIIDAKFDGGCDNTEFTASITTNPLGNVVNNSSTDNCDIACMTLSQSSFGCGDVGINTVTLTVTDATGNTGTCISNILVLNPADASFTYPAINYCATDESDPSPTITGLPGGTFSSAPAGLVIDPGTGVIDLSASTSGFYTITYTTIGTCPNTFDLSISISGGIMVDAGPDQTLDPFNVIDLDATINGCGSALTEILISEDFESGNGGWTVTGADGGGNWVWGSCPAPYSAEGNNSNVWYSTPFNPYGSSLKGAHVTSPTYDFSNFEFMRLFMDVRWEAESTYDGMTLAYSLDGGATWDVLGQTACGINCNYWYDASAMSGMDALYSGDLGAGADGWGSDVQSAWISDFYHLPSWIFDDASSVTFRMYWAADNSGQLHEGFAFDNFRIEGEITCDYAWTGPNSFTSNLEDPQVTASAGPEHAGEYILTVSSQGCTTVDTVEIILNTLDPNITECFDLSTAGNYNDIGISGEPFNCPMFGSPEFTGSDEELYVFYQPTTNETVNIYATNAVFDDTDGLYIGIFEWNPGFEETCIGGNGGVNVTSAEGEILDVALTGGTTYVIVIGEDYNDAASVCLTVEVECATTYTDNIIADCIGDTYSATLNFSNLAGLAAINLTDGTTSYNGILTGTDYVFPYTDLGDHNISIIGLDGSGNTICIDNYTASSGCNGCEVFEVCAPDITNTCARGDLTNAVNEGLAGAGPEMSEGGVTGFGNYNSLRDCNDDFDVDTDFKDVWYQINNAGGSNDITLSVTGLQAGEYLAYVLYSADPGTSQSANVITGWASPSASASGSFFSNSVTTRTMSGFNAYPNIYVRVMAANPNDDEPCISIVHPANFTICATIPVPNDECANAADITLNNPNNPLGWYVTADFNAATNPGWVCNWDADNPGAGTEGMKDLWYYVDLVTSDGDPTEYSGPYYMMLYGIGNSGDELIVQVFTDCYGTAVSDCPDYEDGPSSGSTIVDAADTLTFASPDSSEFLINNDNPGQPYRLPSLDLYDPVYVRAIPNGIMSGPISLGAHIRAFNDELWRFYDQCIGEDFSLESPASQRINFRFASPSADILPDGSANAISDLWYHFEPNTWTGGTTPNTTFLASVNSTYADISVSELATGEEIEFILYKETTCFNNILENPATYDHLDNYITSLRVDANGTHRISCLDEKYSGDYIVRIRQAGGSSLAKPVVSVDPSDVKPPENNSCDCIWSEITQGPKIGPNGNPSSDAAHNWNQFWLKDTDPTRTFTFTGSNDCGNNNDCNGISNDPISEADERAVWFVFQVPDDLCNLSNNIQATSTTPPGPGSTVITSMTFDYTALGVNPSFKDAKMAVYDGCASATMLDCSPTLDGAGTSWTAYGLEQGKYYLLKVKPSWLNSDFDYDFDINVRQGDVSPCNDDRDNAWPLEVEPCNDYASLDTFSAEGATESSPVSGVPSNDVWFTFTAPDGANGGPYSYPTSWVTVFFEAVTAHNFTIELYETGGTQAIVTAQAYSTSGNAGDRIWTQFGNLEAGKIYSIRVHHDEGPGVDPQYMINVYTSPANEPGWECGENQILDLSGCSSGCNTLSETWFKLDLPDGAPGNAYWMIEVEGEDQHLDFELRSKYLLGSSSYVGCNGSVDGLEGSCADYDHPCSSTQLEPAVSIVQTTALPGCDNDADPTNESGVRRVYFNMNGAVPGAKDYYYIRVFVSDPVQAASATGVNICNLRFNGAYSTEALASAGGTPDLDCTTPGCDVYNVEVEAYGICSAQDATFTLSFDVTNGSGFYDIIATTANPSLGITAGQVLATQIAPGGGIDLPFSATINGPVTSATTLFVTVTDQSRQDCEGTPVEVQIPACPSCNADAGLISNNSLTPDDLSTCFGSDLFTGLLTTEVYFNADYTSIDEIDPGYAAAAGLDYAFILTLESNNDIVQFNTDGNFDFSTVPVGVYKVWGLSYPSPANTLLGNETNVTDYLNIVTSVAEIIADDDDNSSGGAGSGDYCLDLDDTPMNGMSNTVSVVAAPIITDVTVGCGSTQGGADIIITASANTEYSMDGLNYQASNSFQGVGNGSHVIYVRSTTGAICVTTEVVIVDCADCACPTCPEGPTAADGLIIQISNCPVNEGEFPDTDAQDAAAVACYSDPTCPNNIPFGTWRAAVAFANDPANNVAGVVFDEDIYVNSNPNPYPFGTADGGYDVLTDGLFIDLANAVIDGNGAEAAVGFANINADNVTIVNAQFINWGKVLTIEDAQNVTLCNIRVDNADGTGTDGMVINSNSRNTSVTVIGSSFQNNVTQFTRAVTVLASSPTASVNTEVVFCDTRFSCNYSQLSGAGMGVEHGGARGAAMPGPTVCVIGGGFYDNVSDATGGGLYTKDNSILTIDGVDFVENENTILSSPGGGALHLEGGSIVSVANSNFTDNSTWISGEGGAIKVDGGSLSVSGSVFENNGATEGGAIYMRGGSTAVDIQNNYFIANKDHDLVGPNSKGGAIYVDELPSFATGTLIIENNTFSSQDGTTANDNLSNCGPDIYLGEGQELAGSNALEFPIGGRGQTNWTGDIFNRGQDNDVNNGWLESELTAGDVEITVGGEMHFNLSTANTVIEAYRYLGGSNPLYQHVLDNMNYYAWAFTFAQASASLDHAFVLAADHPDFTIASGYAVVVMDANSNNIQLVQFSGGVDNVAGYNIIINGARPSGGANGYGSSSVKVEYDPATDTWQMFTIHSGGTVIDEAFTPDARRMNISCEALASDNSYSAVDASMTSASLPFTGVYYTASSTTSSRYVEYDNIYYREGTDTDGNGWSGTYFSANSFAGCPTPPGGTPLTAAECDSCIGYVYDYAPDKSVSNPDGITTCYPVCTEGPWTHYGVESEKTIYFSIKHNGNDLDGTAVDVYVQQASETYNYEAVNLYAPVGTTPYPVFSMMMRRGWDVRLGPGKSVDPSKPVAVRFYYPKEERTVIEDQIAAISAADPSMNIVPFYWYKNDNQENHNHHAVADQMNVYSFLEFVDDQIVLNPELEAYASPTAEENPLGQVNYVQFPGITSFSGGSGGGGGDRPNPPPGNPLPVELIEFYGFADHSVNHLFWKTASEINSSHFELERSENGVNFEQIDWVPAQGYSVDEQAYSSTDENPYQGTYYRLRMVDNDDTYEYSSIIYIEREGNGAVTFGIYPNPFNEVITIDFSLGEEGLAIFMLRDIIGREIMRDQRDIIPERNRIFYDLKDLPSGMYIISISMGDHIIEKKIIKK